MNADLEERVRAMLAGAAAMHGLEVDIRRIGSVTTAKADAAAIEAVRRAAHDAGLGVIDTVPHGAVASDDATALMRRVQQHGGVATYGVLGADLAGAHHTAHFDFDEAALAGGVAPLEAFVRHGHETVGGSV